MRTLRFLGLIILLLVIYVVLVDVAYADQAVLVATPGPSSGMLDFQVIVQPILEVIGLAIAAFITTYVPRVIAAFEARTGIQFTEQQRAIMLGSVQTSAGELQTLIDQKALDIAHVNVSNPVILAKARGAIDAVSNASKALGMTEAGVARMLVGRLDTSAANNVPAVAPIQGFAFPSMPAAIPAPIVASVVDPILNPGAPPIVAGVEPVEPPPLPPAA